MKYRSLILHSEFNVAFMLVHCFCLFEFKFEFEFKCLNPFQNSKTFFFIFPSFLSFSLVSF
jgi:hypothetical protein